MEFFKLYLDNDHLGIGDWGLAQSPIPNPQSPIPNNINFNRKLKIK
jgi:hypothetical protein